MASLDGKLLGEKQHNYASSSEEEEEIESPVVPSPMRDGLPQTGPKGVLTDYYRSQEEELRKRIVEKEKKQTLIQKHSATAKTYLEEHEGKEANAMANLTKALDNGVLDKDPFLREYRAKKMEELKEQAKLGSQRLLFGNLVEIRADRYASIIDTAPPQTYVVMHIYDEFLPSCQKVNKALTQLAKTYPVVKFCRVQCQGLGMSDDFIQKGLPAILVYKGGVLLGNLLRVTDTLRDDFTAEDMESFLQDKNCLPADGDVIVERQTSKQRVEESDSD